MEVWKERNEDQQGKQTRSAKQAGSLQFLLSIHLLQLSQGQDTGAAG